MASRYQSNTNRQRVAIKRYYEKSNQISYENSRQTYESKTHATKESEHLTGSESPKLQGKVLELESQVKRLEIKLQQVKPESQDHDGRVDELKQSRDQWKKACLAKEEKIHQLQQELSTIRKRQLDQVKELETEIKWQSKKIKMLEKTVENNNEIRITNQRAHQEKMNTMQEEIDQLIKERRDQQSQREQDMIEIQNLENAVKHLHDENVLLKETPVRVVIPPRQTKANNREQTFYTYKSHGRPVAPQISILDHRANQRRIEQVPQSTRQFPNSSQSNQWPYSASEEDLFWGR